MSEIRFVATGSYLPEKSLNNDYFKYLDTSDEWIVQHTGIKKRHIANKEEKTCYMGYMAAKQAIENASINPVEIDLIIVATTTNDVIFPSCAVSIQQMLGCNCPAFDVQAVCAGFIFGISAAIGYLHSGFCKTILIVGSERMSDIVDWQDRKTCVLFGDGAGAVILKKDRLIKKNLYLDICSDGRYSDILYTSIDSGVIGKLSMNGKSVFRHAVEKISSSVLNILNKASMGIDDIGWFVPHQANIRIIDSVAERINLSKEKCIITVDEHANTSAASIPLALDCANKKNLLKKGDIIVCSAIGGGLCWGTLLFEW